MGGLDGKPRGKTNTKRYGEIPDIIGRVGCIAGQARAAHCFWLCDHIDYRLGGNGVVGLVYTVERTMVVAFRGDASFLYGCGTGADNQPAHAKNTHTQRHTGKEYATLRGYSSWYGDEGVDPADLLGFRWDST